MNLAIVKMDGVVSEHDLFLLLPSLSQCKMSAAISKNNVIAYQKHTN
jgi:hypothetical protein